jgi:hypothetical protein
MSEFEARLTDIVNGPWRGQSAFARERLPAMTGVEARRYFRYHDVAINDPEEQKFRESFDQALEELQILELAVCSGYLPLAVVRQHAAEEFTSLLGHAAARRYVTLYDFVPVRFLAARLDIDIGAPPVTPPAVNPKAGLRFATFLALHSEFVSSPAVELFTQLIDDYRFLGLVDAPFLLRHLRQPSAGLTEAQQRVVQTSCLGLLEFLQLLGDLFLQLEDDERPLYGCVYAYWLSHFFGLRRGPSGYVEEATSFRDLDPAGVLRAAGDEDVSDSETERLRARMATLHDTWSATRRLLESVSST